MTETNSAFPNALEAPVMSENGHSKAASTPDAAPLSSAHVDPLRRVFITSRGNEIALSGKRVSALMLERLANEGKPQIPMKKVLLLGKREQLEANPNDPGYLALLAEWEANQRINSLVYVFTIGVGGKPPEDFVDEQRAFFPNISDVHMKYLWISSQLPDEDINELAEAITGQSMATQKGLEQAADSFPNKD
jgi:hypothetical protein